MLNPKRPSNPTTLGRILAGEQPLPPGKPAVAPKSENIPFLEFPMTQSVTLICVMIFLLLVAFSMGVVIGKRSAEQTPKTVASTSPSGQDANALPPSSRGDFSKELPVEEPLTKSPRTVSMPQNKKVNTFPASGLSIPPDTDKLKPPKSRDYAAPGRPVSSPVPGATVSSNNAPIPTVPAPPASGAAPTAPSHDAASQVAAASAPAGTLPATTTKPVSPVPAVENAPPKSPAPPVTPPTALVKTDKTDKKTEPALPPGSNNASDSGGKDKTTETKTAEPAKDTPGAKGAYCVQVASFSGPNRQAVAEEYQKRLESNSDLRPELVTSEDGRYVKVYVGSFSDKQSAATECEKLRKRGGFTGAFVKAR